VFILIAVGLAAVTLYPLTTGQRVVAPPRPEPMGRMSPRHLQEHLTANIVAAAATAGREELRAQPGYSEPISTTLDDPTHPRDALVLTKIRSESPHSTRERALNDALLVAQKQLVEQLRTGDSAVSVIPPIWVIRDQYVRPESVVEIHPTQAIQEDWAAANLDPGRVWVEFDLVVSPEQMRMLRAGQRRLYTGMWFGLVFVALVAGYGFLRLDAMTKGYLTTVLGIAAGGLVLAAVVALATLR
jgi:hypothetical protein